MDIWQASRVGIPGFGDRDGLVFGHLAPALTATLSFRLPGAGHHRTAITTGLTTGRAEARVATTGAAQQSSVDHKDRVGSPRVEALEGLAEEALHRRSLREELRRHHPERFAILT